jgi:succinate dehydrogenase / fumarate reductase membrane anchor subunit
VAGAKLGEKIEVRRSQLGRVRGLGAAGSGVEHWWRERIAAMALVPLSVWFVVSVLSMLGADQAVVAAWAGHPVNAVLLLALIVMTFHHTALGLQVVYEDYIDSVGLRTGVTLATNGACLILGLMASLAVLKLALAVAPIAAQLPAH